MKRKSGAQMIMSATWPANSRTPSWPPAAELAPQARLDLPAHPLRAEIGIDADADALAEEEVGEHRAA